MKTIVLFALTLVLCNTASAQLTAGFTANKWSICKNDDLLVTDTSTTATGTITSWTWNFGDGSALFVGQQPQYHHYTVDDTVYTVTLTVINSTNDTAVATHTVTINPSPKPIVQVTPSPACAYTSVNFSNVGTSVDSVPFYIWTIDSTGAITNGNINYVPQNSGADSMCLTVQTIKGCKGSTCTPFTVYPKIEPYFTNTVCANLTMCFNDVLMLQMLPSGFGHLEMEIPQRFKTLYTPILQQVIIAFHSLPKVVMVALNIILKQ